MTKYILHGGNAQDTCSENDEFFKEILKTSTNTPKILLVHFASRPENDEINKQKDIAQFERVKGDKILNFEISDKETFIEQIKRNDIIYFAGGTSVRLFDALKGYSNLRSLFDGKIIAGESAGANALSTYCYSKSGGGVMRGFGILPVKMIPHFKEELSNVFDGIADDLENVFLPEYNFRVFEV